MELAPGLFLCFAPGGRVIFAVSLDWPSHNLFLDCPGWRGGFCPASSHPTSSGALELFYSLAVMLALQRAQWAVLTTPGSSPSSPLGGW